MDHGATPSHPPYFPLVRSTKNVMYMYAFVITFCMLGQTLMLKVWQVSLVCQAEAPMVEVIARAMLRLKWV